MKALNHSNAYAPAMAMIAGMASKLCVAACIAGMCFHSFADATAGKVYRMKAMTLGTMERNAEDCTKCTSASTVVPSTETLAFPGLTVADLWEDKYTIYGFFCGGYVGEAGRGKIALPMYFGTYTNSLGIIEKAFTSLSVYDDVYIKSVGIEYTNGSDGVYAKAFSAGYCSDDNSISYTQFVSYKADGSYSYYNNEGTVSTGWSNPGGYGIAGLTAIRCPRNDIWLPTWENEANESVLTLDDIKDYDFHAFMTGPAVNSKGGLAEGWNKRLTVDGSGSVTGMTVEFQMLDDKYVKCVIVDFQNGANGIECKARSACYQQLDAGGRLGYEFIKDDGTYDGNAGSLAYGNIRDWGSGYAIYELTATPPPPQVMLELDESKTWTQLVAGVDLGARDMRLNVQVTGENPVLTFDAPIDRAYVAFTGTPGAFSLKSGNAAFTIDRLVVGRSFTVGMDEALSPTTIAVENGARVVYAPEGAVTVTSSITGAGGVEIASGDVTMAGTSDYTGGTIVKAGAMARPGSKTVSRDKLYVGPFGVISSGNPVTVEPGGLYDVNGQDGGGCWAGLQSDCQHR